MMILLSLIITVLLSGFLFRLLPVDFNLPFVVVCILVGFYLLLIPASELYRGKKRRQAWTLFKRASYYPLALLVLVTVKLKI